MGIMDSQVGTRVDEIADGVYRIHTPLPPSVIPGGFSFNQYLILDDEPLLFHTGPRRMFPLVQQAIASVMPLEKLRYVACSHIEADECGSLNELLAVAPHATPVSGQVAVTVSLQDLADRPSAAAILQRLAGLRPGTLACMHGSAWRGDGAALLGELARVFG
jgi:flavorubredoxin